MSMTSTSSNRNAFSVFVILEIKRIIDRSKNGSNGFANMRHQPNTEPNTIGLVLTVGRTSDRMDGLVRKGVRIAYPLHPDHIFKSRFMDASPELSM
jgi:hypothetical protein